MLLVERFQRPARRRFGHFPEQRQEPEGFPCLSAEHDGLHVLGQVVERTVPIDSESFSPIMPETSHRKLRPIGPGGSLEESREPLFQRNPRPGGADQPLDIQTLDGSRSGTGRTGPVTAVEGKQARIEGLQTLPAMVAIEAFAEDSPFFSIEMQ